MKTDGFETLAESGFQRMQERSTQRKQARGVVSVSKAGTESDKHTPSEKSLAQDDTVLECTARWRVTYQKRCRIEIGEAGKTCAFCKQVKETNIPLEVYRSQLHKTSP